MVQGIESDGQRDHLAISAENKLRGMLFPAPSKASKLGDSDIVMPNLGETVEKEHKRLLARNSNH